MSGAAGKWPSRGEWLGLIIGFGGVALLNLGGDLRGAPIGAVLLLLSTLLWSLGSVLKPRLPMPAGLAGSGAMMLVGGLVDLALSFAFREHLTSAPAARPLLALAWLVVGGSIVAYSAFAFLLSNVRPALATSYAYVNPVVALLLGAALLAEPISANAMVAMALILSGVAVVSQAKARKA